MPLVEQPEEKHCLEQLNDELRHAELELLSAHCATYKLRLHFSTERVARLGRRDVLRKSIKTASELNEYYASVGRHIPGEPVKPAPQVAGAAKKHLHRAIKWFHRIYGKTPRP